jgi:hypothetical protein
MKNGDWKNRGILLAVALVSVGFIGSSYAASSRVSAVSVLPRPVQILDLTLPPGTVTNPFDPPPPVSRADEIAEVTKELVGKETPDGACRAEALGILSRASSEPVN